MMGSIHRIDLVIIMITLDVEEIKSLFMTSHIFTLKIIVYNNSFAKSFDNLLDIWIYVRKVFK